MFLKTTNYKISAKTKLQRNLQSLAKKIKKKKKVSDNAFEIPQQSKKGLERVTQWFSTYPPSTEPMRRSSLSHG